MTDHPLDLLEACQTIFCVGMCEPSENQLQLLLQEAKTHRDKPASILTALPEPVGFPIAPFQNARIFLLEWKRYVAYMVTNESYSVYPEGQIFSGKNLQVFTDSKYLDFLSKTTVASEFFPGPYQHYRVASEMHTIDVASEDPPEITIISKADVKAAFSQVCRVTFLREDL